MCTSSSRAKAVMQHPESVDAARNEAGSFQLAGGSKNKLPILGGSNMIKPYISYYLILVNCEGFPMDFP